MPDYERPQTVEELNRQLADTIGASVEQLMGGAGWSEANNMNVDPRNLPGQPGAGSGGEEHPVVTPVSGQPVTPVGGPPVAAPVPLGFDPELYKDANGKYIGKYDSVEQFVKGIGHAMDMTKTVLAQKAELDDRLQRMTTELEQLRRTPVTPQVTVQQDTFDPSLSRGNEQKLSPRLGEVLTSLQEGTLDAEGFVKLVDAISEHSTNVARQTVKEETEAREKIARATAERWDRVDQYMTEKYPDSMKFTAELGLFSKTNPEIEQVVTALIEKNLHEKAMEFAWKEFSQVHGLTSNTPPPFVPAPATRENVIRELTGDAADQVRREAVEASRKDAGILGADVGGVHGVHENANVGPTAGEVDEAAALMRQGNGEKWRSLVFKDILNHPIFNGTA